VSRRLKHYNLKLVLAVGYRVRSPRGTQFRQWATAQLEQYLVKGFAMDDERLKQVGGGNYFDELLARIRDIRSSERVFWRKVLDIYAMSVDYDPREEASKKFFAVVQNKMHWAAHGPTAAEVIVRRADSTQPNMGLTTWTGSRPHRDDVGIAKNYLSHAEIETLNLIVSAYLDFAELQARPLDYSETTFIGQYRQPNSFKTSEGEIWRLYSRQAKRSGCSAEVLGTKMKYRLCKSMR
jgi:hypothetical protein